MPHTRVKRSNRVASVINLNKFRKKKAKLERERRAETNRRLHGRSKAERAREELEKRLLEVKVEGAHLERNPPVKSDDDG